MKSLTIVLVLLLFCQCRPKQVDTATDYPGKPEIPSFIKKDHADLLERIQGLSLYSDSTGRAALKLRDIIQHHFKEEEDYVLPQLGLLQMLAKGALPERKAEAVQLSEKLKFQLTHLSVEHQVIKALVEELTETARKDNHPEFFDFKEELEKHATLEEEVLFPAAVVIGEYLKLKPQAVIQPAF